MRRAALIVALAVVLACCGCGRLNAGTKEPSINDSTRATSVTLSSAALTSLLQKSAAESAGVPAKVDFQTHIKPILETRCQPCHFSGGKVYDKLPFDRPETIKSLGTKLFTRIKDENDRRLITAFLAQQ